MITAPMASIVGLVALNLIALGCAVRLALGTDPRRATAPEASDAPAATASDDAHARALRDLVGEIDRIEAVRAASPRGESRLATDLGRWRTQASGGALPRAAASGRIAPATRAAERRG